MLPSSNAFISCAVISTILPLPVPPANPVMICISVLAWDLLAESLLCIFITLDTISSMLAIRFTLPSLLIWLPALVAKSLSFLKSPQSSSLPRKVGLVDRSSSFSFSTPALIKSVLLPLSLISLPWYSHCSSANSLCLLST